MASSTKILISSVAAGVVAIFCLLYSSPFFAVLAAFASGSGWAFFIATRDVEKELKRLKGDSR